MRPIISLVCLAVAFAGVPAAAATKIWTSTNSFAGLWSDGANWQDGTPPVSGDRLVFRCCARNTSRNDIANLVLDGIDFESYQLIEGNQVDLSGAFPITVGPGPGITFFFATPVRFLNTNALVSSASDSSLLEFGAEVILHGGTLTIDAPGSQIDFGYAIRDEINASLHVNANRAIFSADNTFRGTFVYTGHGGFLIVRAHGMGLSSAIFDGDAAVNISSSQPEVINMLVDLRMAGPNSRFEPLGGFPTTFQGPVGVTGPQHFLMGEAVTFAGNISGNGRVIVEPSPNPMTLSNPLNTFTGGLQVQAATVHLAAAGAIPAAGELVIESGGTVDFATYAQGATALTCAGTMAMGSGAKVTVATTVDLRGCTLQLAYATNPVGEVRLIDNAGSAPVVGTFAGLPERSPVTVGAVTYYISYEGGDGNDVILRSTQFALPTTSPHVQDMWWTPLENGWGMSIVQHGDKLFSVIYAYDGLGKPTWYVMPTGTWNYSFTRYVGDVYAPRGSPFFQYDTASFVPGPGIGILAITLDNYANAANAVVDYTIDGVTGRKLLTRQSFGRGTSVSGGIHGDMWWGGASQSGWGLAILQQGDTLFNVWFSYDASGARTWFVMPGGTWSTTDTYDGRLYRTLGSPWLGRQYDPTQLQVFDAGRYRLRFSGDSATLDYAVDTRSGTLRLERQPF